MVVLAIETSGIVASVAIASNDKIIAEYTVNNKKTHSENLMPMIESVFRMTSMELKDIDSIAVSIGPGSFTGLRIGFTTAKALAHGGNKKMIKVPTLDALAYNVFDETKLIVPIMDAKRSEVYSCIYKNKDGTIVRLTDYYAKNITELIDEVISYNQEAIFLGDGVAVYEKEILKYNKFQIMPENNQMLRAASVALAAFKLDTNSIADYTDSEILYLRKPQAEREFQEKKMKED